MDKTLGVYKYISIFCKHAGKFWRGGRQKKENITLYIFFLSKAQFPLTLALSLPLFPRGKGPRATLIRPWALIVKLLRQRNLHVRIVYLSLLSNSLTAAELTCTHCVPLAFVKLSYGSGTYMYALCTSRFCQTLLRQRYLYVRIVYLSLLLSNALIVKLSYGSGTYMYASGSYQTLLQQRYLYVRIVYLFLYNLIDFIWFFISDCW